ncbi:MULTISPECIES: aminotransferase [unclassified Variovorax]|jgi:4-aminobutyrate--pyruvate transaminase|uniref:aminotransferase n=1 Tax=unclassified Variovorax TaxID=663243 RepID=UPI000F7F7D1A|nr:MULTISPECIES: aminotransferase [unclassified Variovorax]RSZ33846.1 aminotransferase class III-fold pyridoxal phosphate-dependent enzyme [Variovorax sp. 553]RSZ34157.1 aminotransferase class III-fold pyridoxal phosphate-dependent enzyme [Variovorax sp. 679]
MAEPLGTGDKDVATHLHSYTNLAALPQTPPLVIVEGDGIHVVDEKGKRYLEAMSGLWCASLGFSNKRLAEAGAKALNTLPYYHTFNQRTNVAVADLAERLLALAPAPMARVFFANSGSEANDSAVKMVWYYHNAIGQPERKKIIARRNAYHGVTVAAASMGGLDGNHRDFDLPIATAPARFLHVDCPHHYRYAEPGETEQDFSTRLAQQLEQTILAEGPQTVAAFIAEPVMGAGGVLVPPAGYFEKVQAVLRKYGVLMIADEVICGFGRTGNMFGSTTFGIQPDILSCAKALSSGYVPISAVMVNEKVHSAIAANSGKLGSFGHGYTYSGHPVACAVALETLKVYEDERIVDHVREIAPAFQAGLRAFAERPWVGNVRGVGMIGAIELMADKAARTPFAAERKAGYRFAALALEEGLIVRAMGDSIGLCPPLIITRAELDDLFARLGRAMDRFDQETKA